VEGGEQGISVQFVWEVREVEGNIKRSGPAIGLGWPARVGVFGVGFLR
jgi:hypothetical protein